MAPLVTAVMLAVPAAPRRLRRTCGVRVGGLTKVVARPWPFQAICEGDWRFVPVTVRVKAGEPTFAVDGLRAVMAGAGVMVKVRALERTPSVAATVIEAVP